MGATTDDLAPLKQTLSDLLVMLRKRAQLTQQELADRIGYARVTVGSAEAGTRLPSEAFCASADAVLGADGQLVRAFTQLDIARNDKKRTTADRDRVRRAARAATQQTAHRDRATGADRTSTLGMARASLAPAENSSLTSQLPDPASMPMRDLGVSARPSGMRRPDQVVAMTAGDGYADLTAQPGAEVVLAAVPTSASGRWQRPRPGSVPVEEAMAHLRRYWHVLVAADNLFGPAHALGAVHAQIAVIEALLPDSSGKTRQALLGLGAQYAESAGWLWEDARQTAEAAAWTSRALEWAHAAADPRLVAWALFRRSQQAAAERDTARTLGLIEAARRSAADLPGPMRAALAQQEAHGLAMDGDEQRCHNRLDDALNSAAVPDVSGDAGGGHGSFCTASYIEMQRAACWMILRRPRRAVSTYRSALAGLPAAYRRDRAFGLARMAAALIAVREFDAAAGTALEAVRIAEGSGSARTLTEVHGVAARLSAHRNVPSVAALLDGLAPGPST